MSRPISPSSDRSVDRGSSTFKGSNGSPAVFYERCINNYKREIKALHDQIHELQNRLQQNESPDNRLIETCSDLQQESARLNQEIAAMQRRNIELSQKIANESTFECLEQNKNLTIALQEANQREQTLIEKYKSSSQKFKDLKQQFEQTSIRYKELIKEKKQDDQRQIKILEKMEKVEKDVKHKENELKKYKESLNKVMKHYLDAKARKQETENKLRELVEQNSTALQKLEHTTSKVENAKVIIAQKNEEVEKLQKELNGCRNDITEFQKQISIIQAEKEKYQKIEIKLNEYKENFTTLSTQMNQAQNENAEYKQKNQELATQLSKKAEALNRANAKLTLIKDKSHALSQEIDQLNMQLDAEKVQSEEKINSLNLEIKACQEENEKLHNNNMEYEETIDNLKQEREELKSKIDQYEENISNLKKFELDCQQYLTQIDNIQRENEEIRSDLITEQENNLELRKKNHKHKEKINGLEIQLSEIEQQYERLKNDQKQLKNEYDCSVHEANSLKGKIDELEETINKKNAEIKSKSAEIDIKNAELTTKVAEIRKYTSDLADKDRQILKLQNDFASLKEKQTIQEEEKSALLQTLNRQIDDLKKQNKTLTELLNTSQKHVTENRQLADHISAQYDELSHKFIRLHQLKTPEPSNDDLVNSLREKVKTLQEENNNLKDKASFLQTSQTSIQATYSLNQSKRNSTLNDSSFSRNISKESGSKEDQVVKSLLDEIDDLNRRNLALKEENISQNKKLIVLEQERDKVLSELSKRMNSEEYERVLNDLFVIRDNHETKNSFMYSSTNSQRSRRSSSPNRIASLSGSFIPGGTNISPLKARTRSNSLINSESGNTSINKYQLSLSDDNDIEHLMNISEARRLLDDDDDGTPTNRRLENLDSEKLIESLQIKAKTIISAAENENSDTEGSLNELNLSKISNSKAYSSPLPKNNFDMKSGLQNDSSSSSSIEMPASSNKSQSGNSPKQTSPQKLQYSLFGSDEENLKDNSLLSQDL